MKDPNSNPNEELTRRFRADLGRPISERYYSEDELVSIFDYSGDRGDDYLRTEALLLGARLYPDSPDLLQRRAIFYRGFADRSFDDFMGDHPDVSEPLWEILKMVRFTGTPDEAAARLSDFLEHNRLVTDEEVIQFVQLVEDLGLSDWLFDRIELLKSKTDYQPTLLYELAATAEGARRYDLEIELLEQLTELDAYCADYWRLLAKIQLQENLRDEAMNSIELALAIDPDDADSLTVKLSLLKYGQDGFADTARRIFRLKPENADTIDTLAATICETSDKELIQEMFESLFAYIDDMPELIEQAIAVSTTKLQPVIFTALERLYDSGQTDRELWLSLAASAYEAGKDPIVSQILRIYEARNGHALNHDFLTIKALYRHRHYELVVEVFAASDNDGTIRRPENMLAAYAMFVMALARMGSLKEALSAAKGLLGVFDERSGVVSPIEAYGMNMFLTDISKKLEEQLGSKGARSFDWSAYDPLGLDRL